jgi:hypothetical protein
MSINSLVPINTLVLPSAPTSPTLSNGDMYYDTTLSALRVYSGSAWVSANTGTGGGGSAFTYSNTAPSGAVAGDRWWNIDENREYIYLNDGTSSQWVDANSNAFGGVLAETLQLATGTATLAPLDFAPGVLLTTPAGGAMEYDGKAPYFTPDTSAIGGRGVIDTSLIAVVGAIPRALTSSTTAQPLFATPTNGALALAAGTTYMLEGWLNIATGTVAHTKALLFAGTATFTSFHFSTMSIMVAAAGTPGTAQTTWFNAATGGNINSATSTTAAGVVWVRGIIRCNVAGTLIPQIRFSVAPTGTNTTGTNSYMKLTPIGSGTVTSIGAWT